MVLFIILIVILIKEQHNIKNKNDQLVTNINLNNTNYKLSNNSQIKLNNISFRLRDIEKKYPSLFTPNRNFYHLNITNNFISYISSIITINTSNKLKVNWEFSNKLDNFSCSYLKNFKILNNLKSKNNLLFKPKLILIKQNQGYLPQPIIEFNYTSNKNNFYGILNFQISPNYIVLEKIKTEGKVIIDPPQISNNTITLNYNQSKIITKYKQPILVLNENYFISLKNKFNLNSNWFIKWSIWNKNFLNNLENQLIAINNVNTHRSIKTQNNLNLNTKFSLNSDYKNYNYYLKTNFPLNLNFKFKKVIDLKKLRLEKNLIISKGSLFKNNPLKLGLQWEVFNNCSPKTFISLSPKFNLLNIDLICVFNIHNKQKPIINPFFGFSVNTEKHNNNLLTTLNKNKSNQKIKDNINEPLIKENSFGSITYYQNKNNINETKINCSTICVGMQMKTYYTNIETLNLYKSPLVCWIETLFFFIIYLFNLYSNKFLK